MTTPRSSVPFPPATPANVRRARRLYLVAVTTLSDSYGYIVVQAAGGAQELIQRAQEGQAAGNGVQLVTTSRGDRLIAVYWPKPIGLYAEAPFPDAPVLMLNAEAVADLAARPGDVMELLRAVIAAAEAVQPPAPPATRRQRARRPRPT